MTESAPPFDLVTMGRIGVDLYPPQPGAPQTLVQTFGRFLGGSAADVAVARPVRAAFRSPTTWARATRSTVVCHGPLSGRELERTVRYANAAGALVASRLACSSAMPTGSEADALLASGTRS